jgi:hypothetical protein
MTSLARERLQNSIYNHPSSIAQRAPADASPTELSKLRSQQHAEEAALRKRLSQKFEALKDQQNEAHNADPRIRSGGGVPPQIAKNDEEKLDGLRGQNRAHISDLKRRHKEQVETLLRRIDTEPVA